MQSKDAILYVLNSARYITDSYLNDLSDDDILVRPTAQAHHIAWQLGHLLLSEAMMANGVMPGTGITFPHGFAERHSAQAGHDSSLDLSFCTKSQYIDLRTTQRQKTLELIETIADQDLSAPGPEKMRAYAPTQGSVLLAIGTHELMHSGQWAVVRRVLAKPVVV